MSEQDLRDLVCHLADQAAWRSLVHEDLEQRRFEQLLRDDDVAVWVLSWMQFHETGSPAPAVSRGAVAVVEGGLVEERLAIGGTPRRATDRAADRFTCEPAHVHRMHNETEQLAVSIH